MRKEREREKERGREREGGEREREREASQLSIFPSALPFLCTNNDADSTTRGP